MRRVLVFLAIGAILVPIGSHATSGGVIQSTDRVASASWIRLERVRYVVEVTERTIADATVASSVHAGRGVSGQVTAAIELCDETLTSCERGQTWTGTLGSALTNGVAFDADPALRAATLSGWLRDGDGEHPCLFTVRWASEDAPAPLLADPAVEPSGLSGGVALARTGTASVTASCWRTELNSEFSSGPGRLEATHNVVAAAV